MSDYAHEADTRYHRYRSNGERFGAHAYDVVTRPAPKPSPWSDVWLWLVIALLVVASVCAVALGPVHASPVPQCQEDEVLQSQTFPNYSASDLVCTHIENVR